VSCFETRAVSITPSPICSVYTPNSILNHKEKYHILFAGNRPRYSTCTGAVWFHDHYVAALNLYGKTIHTYKFNKETEQFDLIQQINNEEGAYLHYSENLSISPDGTLLAVCYNDPPGINIYQVDINTHTIMPNPVLIIKAPDLVHRVRFSSDGNYLAYVTFNKKEALVVGRLHQIKNQLYFKPSCKKINIYDLHAKSIEFTKNNKFVIVAYCYGIGDIQLNKPLKNIIASYIFDVHRGTIGQLISCIEQDFSTEDIALLNNDTTIIVTNQARDELIVYSFNPETGQLASDYQLIKNPEAELSFPHGITISPDEQYMIVTNYGDDKFNLYKLQY
jgi:6-phosphogluconolactonase (cycloisomerase 2 family)